jgi:nicotinamide mononucleotide (NMN) deamidase PncC
MATQVNHLFISDYGIAITGYATKMPEKGVNNLFAKGKCKSFGNY